MRAPPAYCPFCAKALNNFAFRGINKLVCIYQDHSYFYFIDDSLKSINIIIHFPYESLKAFWFFETKTVIVKSHSRSVILPLSLTSKAKNIFLVN